MRNIVLLFIVTLISCTEEKTKLGGYQEPVNHEMMYKEIIDFHDSYELAIKENRLDDLDNHYAADSKVIPPGGEEWDKLAALEKKRGVLVAYDSLFITIEETSILNDSMAYDWGTSLIYYTDDDGQGQQIEDSFFVILKRRNSEWKIYRELSSSFVE